MTSSRPGRIKGPALERSHRASGIRFDSQAVIQGNPELLLASKVAFGYLDGDVAKQELNLIQFAACEMAETGAGAPQVVRSQLVDRGTSRCGTLGDIPSPDTSTALLIARNTRLRRPLDSDSIEPLSGIAVGNDWWGASLERRGSRHIRTVQGCSKVSILSSRYPGEVGSDVAPALAGLWTLQKMLSAHALAFASGLLLRNAV